MDQKNTTINDFGEQWSIYRDNKGFYGSMDLFSDIIFPFLTPGDVRNCKVAEIGSGTGRIVIVLLEAGRGMWLPSNPRMLLKYYARILETPKKSPA